MGATITGAVKDGKLSIAGGGTVTGIPGCETATLAIKMDEAQNFSGTIGAQLKIPGLKESKIDLTLADQKISGSAKVAAEFKGATGSLTVDYKDSKWSGAGTLGYKKGKFDGSIDATLSEAGKLSGKGKVAYAVSPTFKVTAELEMAEDATMKIGGKIEVPSSIDLFKKEMKKELFKYTARIGVPSLSIQLPLVGVVGLEVQVSASADVFAGMSLSLVNITASGSFDTATDNVELSVGGGLQGKAWAGIGVNLRGAIGLGVGPAFIGGYLNARGEGKIEAAVTGNVLAKFNSGSGDLTFDIGVDASAGLALALSIEAGITASVDLWVKTFRKDWPLAGKTWTFNPGVALAYNPQFKYTVGKPVDPAALAPKNPPKLDGATIARGVGDQYAGNLD